MDTLKEMIDIAINMREIFVTAVCMAIICGMCVAFVGIDIYQIYADLLPWQTLWDQLNILNKIRFIFMFLMFSLFCWYGVGAIKSYRE